MVDFFQIKPRKRRPVAGATLVPSRWCVVRAGVVRHLVEQPRDRVPTRVERQHQRVLRTNGASKGKIFVPWV